MFNPSRLVLARQRRGLTQTALARTLGISVRMVAAYEGGEKAPSEETLVDISRLLSFPEEFFKADDPEALQDEQVSFRALSAMTARQRDAALAAGSLALDLNRWLEPRFGLPAPSLPDLRHFGPEAAAMALRGEWGMGERAIKNMVHRLEVKGVRVFSLAEHNREVDAFSFWKAGTPFVFLNTIKSPERSRFDAAHELGHLVLHRHGAPSGREAEHQANEFAAAFLMPRASVIARAPRNPRLDDVLPLRSVWGVSAAAIVRRLHDVKMLSDWAYRSLSIEIGRRGLGTHEETGAQRETSQVLNKVFTTMRAEGITKADVARELRIDATELDALVFGLVTMSPVAGGRNGEAPPQKRGSLRLVPVSE